MKKINKLQKKVSILKKKHIQNRTDRRTAMRIPIASDEQRVAVEHLLREENVYVDAVAGSGKSTTVLTTLRACPEKKFLMIAFNAMLRKETMSKMEASELTNGEVHTYHSLCVKYYLESAHTDSGIRKVVMHRLPPRAEKPLPKFDVVVLDEAQDMSFLYFQWMCKFLWDAGHPFNLMVLGDVYQGIYDFKGADTRLLSMAPQIWRTHPFLKRPTEFYKCTLNTSYRVTNPIAAFYNKVMLGEERLVATKPGDPVVYLRNNKFFLERVVVSQILQMLQTKKYTPGDIFVLGASVKGVASNIRRMENVLVENDIPCYVPTFDTEHIDDKIIAGKVVFSTFHAVKGRERKVVFVMGFDDSYFRVYARNLDPNKCPNTLYVACTRAMEQLYLLEIDQRRDDRPLTFLQMSHRDMMKQDFMVFRGTPREIFYRRNELPDEENGANKSLTELLEEAVAANLLDNNNHDNVQFHNIAPTELVKFMPDYVLEETAPLMESIFIVQHAALPENRIEFPTIIDTHGGGSEDVCDINGVAIPCIYYDYIFSSFAQKMEDNGTSSSSSSSSPMETRSLPAFCQPNHADAEELRRDDFISDSEDLSDVEKDEDAEYVDDDDEEDASASASPPPTKKVKKEQTAEAKDQDNEKEEEEEQEEDIMFSPIGSLTLYTMIKDTLSRTKEGECMFLKKLVLPYPCETPADYLFLSNVFIAAREKLFFKVKQIYWPTDYQWLTQECVDQCMMRCDERLGPECAEGHLPVIEHNIVSYETPTQLEKINRVLSPFFPNHGSLFKFHARADLITSRSLWEIKCTSTVTIEHKFQVVIYAWLWRTIHSPNPTARNPEFREQRDCKLFNIRTGEVLLLNATYEELTTIVVALLRGKYEQEPPKDDETFLQDCLTHIERLSTTN